MGTMSVAVRFLGGQGDSQLLHRLYAEVLTPSFPAAEREPVAKLARVLDAADLRGAVAVDAAGDPVGALFLEWFGELRLGMLCYFAVRPDLRGRGIGRHLVAAAAPVWRETLQPLLILAEAEDPRAHNGGAADYGDGVARLRMYDGFGARRLPVHHVLPELMPGEGRLPHLLLLVMESAEDRVRGAVVEEFLRQYYARMEGGPAHEDDKQLQELLAECRHEFLPLSEL